MPASRRWIYAGAALVALAAIGAVATQPLTLFALPPDPSRSDGGGVAAPPHGDSGWDRWVDPGDAVSPGGASGVLSLVFLAVLVVALVIFVVTLARLARRPPSLEPITRRPHRAAFAPAVAAAPVARVVEDALARLDGAGDVSETVIGCWLGLQASAAEAGLPREPSETSAQYAYRLGADLELSSDALRSIAGLYREARFSEHPIGAAERARALTALRTLQSELTAGAHRWGAGHA